jgi:hypothetical protein
MSDSSRDAAAGPASPVAPQGKPFPEVPYPWIVRAGSSPESLRDGMRTIDAEPGTGANRPEELEAPYLVECAASVIEQMEVGWDEEISSEDSRCRLGFGETPNCFTGEPGIVVRTLVAPGRYSQPLAELLVPAGELEKHGREAFKRLGWNLSKRRIRIVVYRGEGEPEARPAAFAVIADEEDANQFWLLARLLVTPFEVGQWWDPSVEPLCETAVQ